VSRKPARDRRLGWLAVLGGAALAFAVQLAAPVGVPLYDGVVVQEPYRYLHPTGSQPGLPTSYSATRDVVGGISPAFAAATTENPPQAQLIAQAGAFVLSPGGTSLLVSITPVDPPAVAPGGAIAGNVYRFVVTDQAGAPLAIKACDGCLSLSMRAPDGTGDATIERFAGGAWEDVETLPVGIVSSFQTNPTALGDLAVVVAAPVAQPGPDLVLILGAGAVVALVGGLAFLFFFVKPGGTAPPPRPVAGSRSVPSKHKGPRRPPPGRTGR
jgi:hypothetical protein